MVDEYKPLAATSDVVESLGRDLTSSEEQRVNAALTKASELFRKEARRSFTPGRRINRLRSQAGEVRLPETPIVDVHSVTDDDGNPIAFTRFASVLTLRDTTVTFVRVDFSFGEDDVPELVRTTVAGAVASAFDVDKRARAGMTQFQETAGPLNEGGTFAAWAVGGQVTLSPSELAAARSFRPARIGGTHAQQGSSWRC